MQDKNNISLSSTPPLQITTYCPTKMLLQKAYYIYRYFKTSKIWYSLHHALQLGFPYLTPWNTQNHSSKSYGHKLDEIKFNFASSGKIQEKTTCS
jgi:hypothetical protein